jgi:hypothetical protein
MTAALANPRVALWFREATGLPPFVETVPASGQFGEVIEILGNHLSGATQMLSLMN